MPGPRYVGGTNIIPQATGQVIHYIRDAKEFAVNRWVQNIQTPAPVFIWAKLDQDQPVRMVAEAEFAWEDGAERPTGNHNLTSFEWVEGRCFRRDYPYTMGLQAVEVARKFGAFDPEVVEAKSVASQAMTNRTNRIVQMCETVANWGTNAATANVLNAGAGYWNLSSNDPLDPNYLAIKKALLKAAQLINLGTNGRVKPKDLRLVISPDAAMKMANTGEIHDYVKSTAGVSKQNMTDTLGNVNQQWGLPDSLYGIEIVVEDAVLVNIYPNADGTKAVLGSTRNYVKTNDTAFLVSRVGGIDAPYGAPSFSTVQCYFYDYELAVESRTDTWNKRLEGHVVEQFKEVLAAAPAGYLIQDIMS